LKEEGDTWEGERESNGRGRAWPKSIAYVYENTIAKHIILSS
jgi:hypothetical protein